MSFYDKLRKAQRDTENPVFFEEALAEAFERLGLGSNHIGGRDEPDVLLEVLGHKIVIDAKTAKDPIGEPRIGFPALERYKESYGARARVRLCQSYANTANRSRQRRNLPLQSRRKSVRKDRERQTDHRESNAQVTVGRYNVC